MIKQTFFLFKFYAIKKEMIDFSSLFCGIFINRNCRVRMKTLARTLGYHQSLPPSSKFAARSITCPTGGRLTHIKHFISEGSYLVAQNQ